MGLDARVYYARKSLQVDVEAIGAKRDPVTGEYYFEVPPSGSQFPSGYFVAMHRRLGNASAISELREGLRGVIGEQSLLYRKCLGEGGTHSGDTIEYRSLDELESEILQAQFRLREERRPLLQEFLETMAELVSVAKREKNPIVFV